MENEELQNATVFAALFFFAPVSCIIKIPKKMIHIENSDIMLSDETKQKRVIHMSHLDNTTNKGKGKHLKIEAIKQGRTEIESNRRNHCLYRTCGSQ